MNQAASAIVTRTRAMLADLRPQTPFDTTTAEGRGRERQRRANLTTIATAAAYGVRVVTMLVIVPVSLDYLGAERYGLWMTITAFVSFLSFSDLGIGNGLLNLVADAMGRQDRRLAREAVSSASILLTALALLLGVVAAISYTVVPWADVLNAGSQAARAETAAAVAVFLACFLAGLPLGLVARIEMGLQEGYINSLWLALGSVMALGALVLTIRLQAGLPWLVLAISGAPLLAMFLNGAILFRIRKPWLMPSLRHVSAAASKRVANLGVMFFILQISLALAFTADTLIINRILGPEAVTEYAVPQRLFGFLTMFVGFVLMPLWPAYGEAAARGEMIWVGTTLARTLRRSVLVVGPAALALVLLGEALVQLWVGDAVQPTMLLLSGLGLWVLIMSLGNSFAMLLNGLGLLRFQVVTAVLMASSNLIISIVLTHRIGVSGPVWGSVISYSFCVLLPTHFYVRRLLSQGRSHAGQAMDGI